MPTQYQQAMSKLCSRIRNGRFPVDAFLPPVDRLADELDCGVETLRRALLELGRSGVVKGVQRKGTVVLRRPAQGRVCLALAQDPHTNLLLQHQICQALVDAEFEVDVLPELNAPQATTLWMERLLATANAPQYLVALSPVVLQHFDAHRDNFAGRVCVAISQLPHQVEPDCQWIALDPLQEARLVAEHLLETGHQHVAVFGGYEHDEDSRYSAVATYCQSMLEVAGVACTILHHPPNAATWHDMIRESGVTAYWDINDYAAILNLIALGQAGIRVPQDLTIIGRNDTPWSREASPTLTTVSLNPEGTAAAIVNALISPSEQGVCKVTPTLVVRESSRIA